MPGAERPARPHCGARARVPPQPRSGPAGAHVGRCGKSTPRAPAAQTLRRPLRAHGATHRAPSAQPPCPTTIHAPAPPHGWAMCNSRRTVAVRGPDFSAPPHASTRAYALSTPRRAILWARRRCATRPGAAWAPLRERVLECQRSTAPAGPRPMPSRAARGAPAPTYHDTQRTRAAPPPGAAPPRARARAAGAAPAARGG